MTKKIIRIMCVHGLGDHRNSTWEEDWPAFIKDVFPTHPEIELKYDFVTYDDIFETTEVTFFDTVEALWKLGRSGVSSIFRKRRARGSSIPEMIRWTAGYVVAWVENERFRKRTRKKVLDAVRAYKPDVILAHSLGSLVTYNAFSHADAREPDVAKILRKAKYVTFGSQIGNPFVIQNLTPGQILPLKVNHWYHLYNKYDGVFTAPIRLWGVNNFSQIDTPFDHSGIGADHYASGYFRHPVTVDNLWRPLAENRLDPTPVRAVPKAAKRKTTSGPDTKRRALLIGINDYPDPSARLEGCVNDVYLMSSVLQECGFKPQEIRTCLNHRATTDGILERIEWLLDDPEPGDERVLYFSGHGAQTPTYGMNEEPDRFTETLVPYDFSWTPETSITDDQIYALYSQLPYDLRFVMMFDCCHSGGIHRDGGATIRGLNPPDDIRHREMLWNSETGAWEQRKFAPINSKFARREDDTVEARFFGKKGSTERLGRASMLRGISFRDYEKLREEHKFVGPYLPLIIEACQEDQFAYEYRHGATSYGAFTYNMASALRKEKNISFEALVFEVAHELRKLNFDQYPDILGPTKIVQARVPWKTR